MGEWLNPLLVTSIPFSCAFCALLRPFPSPHLGLARSPQWQAQDGPGAAGVRAVFHMDAAVVERGGFADEAEAEAGAFAAGAGARE